MKLPFTPLIESLPSTVPFVGPELQERTNGFPFRARIGANENVFGASPKALAAIKAETTQCWKYTDPGFVDLKEAIADHHRIPLENIVIGEGIDGLLGVAGRLFVEPGVNVVTSLGAYPTFNYHIKGLGGRLVTAPYVDDHESPDALLALGAKENARILYLANPDNPMGTWWSGAQLDDMIARLPDETILFLDEAYVEFAPAGTSPAIDIDNPQVLRFRTFSKAYGLAGARVGYAIGHVDMIRAFDKIRNHFGMNCFAIKGANAAMRDQDWLQQTYRKVEAARERIVQIALDNGLTTILSAANFVAIDCGRDGDYARSVLAELGKQGIFVRMPGIAPQDRCIRVSAGTKADLDLFEECLPVALKQAG